MDLLKLIKKFPNQKSCIQYLEEKRWDNRVKCPTCFSDEVIRVEKENRYKCYSCKRSFSVLKGTIFENTKLPLQKWFIAIYLVMDAKKGISSLQLSRHLKVNKDTALLIQRRIRTVMKESHILKGIIEIDEAYVGANLDKKSTRIRSKSMQHGITNRTPILGMYQREGKLVLKVINKTWAEEIRPIMDMSINPNSVIVSDGLSVYRHAKDKYTDHVVMNHKKQKYNEGIYNTSTIEGFWAMLKRSVIGTYHHISVKHLQEYIDELSFKFNYRKSRNAFNLLIEKSLNLQIPTDG
ncbi:MAG: IS1595 family transposase [Chitinophagales bacterium]|nr:IS1595 family transposase [Chitinophagales bacterium]